MRHPDIRGVPSRFPCRRCRTRTSPPARATTSPSSSGCQDSSVSGTLATRATTCRADSSAPLCPTHDIGGAHRAGLAGDLASVAEQDQRGNAANAKAGGGLPFYLGIELGQAHLRLQLGSGLLEGGPHHLARPAPGRPEIHQNGNVVAPDVFLEVAGCQLHGVGVEKRLVTSAAPGPVGKAGCRYPVYGITAGTDDLYCITHGRLLKFFESGGFGPEVQQRVFVSVAVSSRPREGVLNPGHFPGRWPGPHAAILHQPDGSAIRKLL